MPDDTGLTNSSIDDIIKNYAASLPGDMAKERASASEYEKTAKEGIETIKSNRVKETSILSTMLKNKPPELDTSDIEQPKAPPKFKGDDPWQTFGSAASFVGMLGGLLTRTPFITSMNAATGAINSARQKNFEDYEANLKSWKANSDHVSKLMDWRINGYKAAMEKYKGQEDALQAQLTAIASATQDVTMIQALESGVSKNYRDVVSDEINALEKYNTSKRSLESQHETERHNRATEDEATRRTNILAGKGQAKQSAIADNYDLAIGQVDQLLDKVQKSQKEGSSVTGLGGILNRGMETVTSTFGAGETPASDFASQIATLKLQLPKLLTGASKSAKDERDKIDTILRGVSPGDTGPKTVNALNQIKQLLQARRDMVKSGKEPVEDAGAEAPSATNAEGKTIYFIDGAWQEP